MFFALLYYFSLAWPSRNVWHRAKNNEATHITTFLELSGGKDEQLLSSAKGNKFSRLKQKLLQQTAKLKGNIKTCLICFCRSLSTCTKYC